MTAELQRYYKKLAGDAERDYREFLANRCTDRESIYHGGNVSQNVMLVSPKSTFTAAENMIALYYSRDSRYYQDNRLYEILLETLDCVARLQREDGTFDNPQANFYAAPNTAFMVNRMIPSFRLALLDKGEAGRVITEKIDDIFKKAGPGIAGGGFHTPNHRWANAAALYFLHNRYRIPGLLEAAQSYLAEGIDMDADGDYAEHSAAKYNVVNNFQLLVLWEESGDQKYLDHIKSNLDMMLYYMEPDGSIFTGTSTRIDRTQKSYPDEYFFLYLYMAKETGSPGYLRVARQIMESMIQRGASYPLADCFAFLTLRPELLEQNDSGGGDIPCEYERYFQHSGVVRIRRNHYTVTLLEKNSRFLVINSGSISLYLRIGVSFFNHREFRAEKIIKTADGYRMDYTAQGWYYLPFQEDAGTSDWWKMDHSKRERLEEQAVSIQVRLRETEGGISLRVKAAGCDRVPLKLEFGITKDCVVRNDSFCLRGGECEAITVKSGDVLIKKGADSLRFGPAFAGHMFTEGNQFSEERSNKALTVFFTDYTDFDREILFRPESCK